MNTPHDMYNTPGITEISNFMPVKAVADWVASGT